MLAVWFKINGFNALCWEGKLVEDIKPRLLLSSVKLFCDLNWLIVGAGGLAAWNGLLGMETAANGLLFKDEPGLKIKNLNNYIKE